MAGGQKHELLSAYDLGGAGIAVSLMRAASLVLVEAAWCLAGPILLEAYQGE
jgi:hypothetical protein